MGRADQFVSAGSFVPAHLWPRNFALEFLHSLTSAARSPILDLQRRLQDFRWVPHCNP
jgi:hypothetical protein